MAASASPLPDWADMQGLILSAYPHLHQAAYLLYRITDVDQTRRWLDQHAGQVTTARKNVEAGLAARNVNIALSYTGVAKLCGFDARAQARFANAFTEGIAGRSHRSRILGDTGESRPEVWAWGGTSEPVDLLLMVFVSGDGDSALSGAIDDVQPPRSAMHLVKALPALPLSQAGLKEHFGFTDGISQPILRGTSEAERYPESIHLTELGEVVFGYPDADEKIAQGPSVPEWEGFGRNGTYLVFRQLKQDVAMFWRFMNEKTDCQGRTNPEAAEQLASKIVGRKPDGAPLVPYVNSNDNEFDFAEDPYGYGCPVGAHVRRANPRGLLASKDVPPGSANRRRVLRRGRSYGPKLEHPRAGHDDGHDRGLLFMCLNADFERQFEFINQNWINNRGFAGLADERDPLVGDIESDPCARFTIPGLPARTRIDGLRRFVTVTGGEYFFLPGIAALKYLAGTRAPQARRPHA